MRLRIHYLRRMALQSRVQERFADALKRFFDAGLDEDEKGERALDDLYDLYIDLKALDLPLVAARGHMLKLDAGAVRLVRSLRRRGWSRDAVSARVGLSQTAVRSIDEGWTYSEVGD